MNRRELLHRAAAFGFVGAVPSSFSKVADNHFKDADSRNDQSSGLSGSAVSPLKPPAQGSIPVAFVVSDGAVVIDFSGPWEVFETVFVPGRRENPFQLYTVAATMNAIRASGGLKLVPNYTFESAPVPKVIVVPAQDGSTPAMLDWIRNSSKNTDVTMSVCTGALVLAQTGLLSGRSATTHHGAYKIFSTEFPDIRVKRGARFTEDGNIATAGGLSSGIDLALHVVERYFGRDVATNTAYQMEYQGQGWLNPDSNRVYAQAPISTEEHPLCPVCDMDADKTAPTSVYKGKTYYFCMPEHKALFDKAPEKYLQATPAQ
jgi:YHS domain-containing protein/putative intracellular protease/amidase